MLCCQWGKGEVMVRDDRLGAGLHWGKGEVAVRDDRLGAVLPLGGSDGQRWQGRCCVPTGGRGKWRSGTAGSVLCNLKGTEVAVTVGELVRRTRAVYYLPAREGNWKRSAQGTVWH